MSYLKLIRLPNLLIIALFQYLIRYKLIIPILLHYNYNPVLTDFRFFLLVLSTVLIAASGYVINDYFDIKIDLINKPERMVIYNIGRRKVLFIHVILTFSGVFIGLFLSYIARSETWGFMFLLLPILLWYYSTTFKKQLFIGNLLVSFMTALVSIVVVSLEFYLLQRVHGSSVINSEACSVAWFWTLGFAFFAFIINLIREIIKDMEDIIGDRRGNCHTLPIELGMKYSKILVIIFVLIVIGTIWSLYNYFSIFNNNIYILFYFIFAISVPLLISCILLIISKSPKEYHRISNIYKIIMLLGILFIPIAGYLFTNY